MNRSCLESRPVSFLFQLLPSFAGNGMQTLPRDSHQEKACYFKGFNERVCQIKILRFLTAIMSRWQVFGLKYSTMPRLGKNEGLYVRDIQLWKAAR